PDKVLLCAARDCGTIACDRNTPASTNSELKVVFICLATPVVGTWRKPSPTPRPTATLFISWFHLLEWLRRTAGRGRLVIATISVWVIEAARLRCRLSVAWVDAAGRVGRARQA